MQPKLYFPPLLIATAAVVIILAGVKLSAEIIVPFLLALFIAIICSPIVNFMTKRKIPYGIAITLLFIFILLIFFFLVQLINGAIQEFASSMPQYKTLLAQRLSDIRILADKWHIPFTIDQDFFLNQFDPSVLMNFTRSVLLNFSNVVSSAFILILVVFFMLLEAPLAKKRIITAFSETNEEKHYHSHQIDKVLKGIISYLGVKTFVSTLTGVGIWILLEMCDVQYAILWATLGFLLNYIPNIGSIIAAVPIVVQSLLLNGFSIGMIVAIGIIAINMIVGNMLEPKLMGRTLGLSTLVVFLSLLFWGWLLGTVGMLLSVPLTMALKIALEASPNTERYAALLSDKI